MNVHAEVPLAGIEHRVAHVNKLNGSVAITRRPALLPVRSARDIQTCTAPDYLLKGIIHKGDLSVWFGPSGCGKTFLALHIAHAISTGRQVFSRRVKAAPVLLFALEGSSGLPMRVEAVQAEYGPAPNLFLYQGGNLCLFRNDDVVASVVATIKDCAAGLVIFDTLNRTMSGADENACADMSHMVDVFDRIRKETRAHVLVIHHTGKDEARGSRGHSSLKGALEVEAEVSSDRETGRRTVRFSKMRDGDDNKAYAFDLRQVDLGADDDGDPLSTCVLEEQGEAHSTATRGPTKLTPKSAAAFDALTKALNERGELAPPELGMPAGVRVITKAAWVAEYASVTGDGADTARKAVERAVPNLLAHKRIHGRAPYFWVLK